jgi:hypothetical protein
MHDNYDDHYVKPVFAGAAISGLFAIFYDGIDYSRPDNNESRLILLGLGLDYYGSVDSIKSTVFAIALFVLAWLQRYVTRLMYIVDRRPACIA